MTNGYNFSLSGIMRLLRTNFVSARNDTSLQGALQCCSGGTESADDAAVRCRNHIILMFKKLKPLLPFLGTLCIVLLFHFSKVYVLKFYPVIVNSFIFCVFFSSLFCRETVIQKIAKKMEGGELSDFTKIYTRRLTYVWCVFLFINLSISIATVFMSEKIWTLYNACISYIALGVMFGVEYIVRIILRAKYDRQ